MEDTCHLGHNGIFMKVHKQSIIERQKEINMEGHKKSNTEGHKESNMKVQKEKNLEGHKGSIHSQCFLLDSVLWPT